MDNNSTESNNRRLGGIFLMLGWLTALILISFLVNQIIFRSKTPSFNETYGGTSYTIYRDYDSHFRITGSINGIPVRFLIDTGATSIAIPENIARQANLTKKSEILTQTANGTAIGYTTKIENLAIEKIKLQNFSAIIAPNMSSDEVLLGMSVLSKFVIQQNDETMTLSIEHPKSN